MSHHRAVIIGTFNIGLIAFGLIYLLINSNLSHGGELLALIGLSGTLLVSIAFVIHHFKKAKEKS